MVCGLVYFAVGRSVKFSTKPLNYSKFLLQRRLPAQVLSFPHYSQDNDDSSSGKEKESKEKEGKEKEGKEKAGKEKAAKEKDTKSKPSFPDGKSHVKYVIGQAKKGKITGSDLTDLAKRVFDEAPYKEYTAAPQTVQQVSFLSLAPMMGLPVLTVLTFNSFPCIVFAHLAYGATMLSFLGGCNWYDAISKEGEDLSYEKLGWCLVPQLIGWTSLIMPLPIGILLTSFGFCISLVHDVLLTNYPPWMKSLRLVVTSGTLMSFALMLLLCLILSRRRSWSSRSRSDSRSRSRSRRSRSPSSDKKETHSRSNSSKSHSRSRSTSRDKSKSRKRLESSSSSSRSAESPKRMESPPKITVPRYYGRNRKDSSSSLSLDSSDTDSKTNFLQPSSSNSNRNNVKKNTLDDYCSGGRSAGNARPTSKQTPKERPQEKLKKKMQALLNKQFRADKKAEKERMEKAEQERQDREAELRDIAIKIRRRERYLRHRGEDEENDGEREALRRRERYLRRSEEEDGKRADKRDGDGWSESSGSGKSKSRSPESKSRRSRSPRRNRRSRSSSPKTSKLGKRTLVDY